MAKKPAITGLARPEGIIDDVVGPLGNKAVKRVRQSVRRAVKANTAWKNVAQKGVKSHYAPARAKSIKRYELAREEFVRAEQQASRLKAGVKPTYKGQAKNARYIANRNVPEMAGVQEKYYRAYMQERAAMASRAAKRAKSRAAKRK